MLHLLCAPPLQVSTVESDGHSRLGCLDLSYETACLVLCY